MVAALCRLWVDVCIIHRHRILGYFIDRGFNLFLIVIITRRCMEAGWVCIFNLFLYVLLTFWRFKAAISDHDIKSRRLLRHRVRLLFQDGRGPIVIVDEELVLNDWRFLGVLWS